MQQQSNPKSPLSELCAIIAELGIVILGVFALVEGLDGAIFVTSIVALSGLGGYHIRHTNGKTK